METFFTVSRYLSTLIIVVFAYFIRNYKGVAADDVTSR